MTHASRRPAPAALLALCAAGALTAPAPLSAQVVRGTVIDDTNDRPVPGASVGLVLRDRIVRAVEADDLGRFLLPLPGTGDYALDVERLGYVRARSRIFKVEAGDTMAVEFRVLPDAVLLEPLIVTGTSRAGRSQFERRRTEWGRGIFLGPEQIDSIAPRHVGEVFRGLEKVQLRWDWGQLSSGASGPLPRIRTYLGRGCMLYMVDHVPVRPEPWIREDWAGYQLSGLRPDDLVAVEVYRYVGEAPPELRRYASQTRTIFTDTSIETVDIDLCGLTVIWTRAGW